MILPAFPLKRKGRNRSLWWGTQSENPFRPEKILVEGEETGYREARTKLFGPVYHYLTGGVVQTGGERSYYAPLRIRRCLPEIPGLGGYGKDTPSA
jgi:hypothetical protein